MTLYPKVKSITLNPRCHLYTINEQCVQFVHSPLKMLAEFVLKDGFKYFNLDPRLWGHIGDLKKVSEYDQEIPQSQKAGQTTAPWGRATEHLQ